MSRIVSSPDIIAPKRKRVSDLRWKKEGEILVRELREPLVALLDTGIISGFEHRLMSDAVLNLKPEHFPAILTAVRTSIERPNAEVPAWLVSANAALHGKAKGKKKPKL